MTRLEASVLINKSPEDIFAFFSVPENHAKFIPGMLEFKKTSAGPLGQVGATARGIRRDLGLRWDVLYEITEFQPNDHLGMKGVMGPINFKDGYVLEPQGSSTRVKFWLELTLNGLAKLAQPFIALIGKTHAHETLANLKNQLESPR
ncbi:MAG TPA: SRPBCC family protein [Anaerolineales bacterium]|jgi:carbon monoxide dehydrogenase subunit G